MSSRLNSGRGIDDHLELRTGDGGPLQAASCCCFRGRCFSRSEDLQGRVAVQELNLSYHNGDM